jgi:hypothetical protein
MGPPFAIRAAEVRVDFAYFGWEPEGRRKFFLAFFSNVKNRLDVCAIDFFWFGSDQPCTGAEIKTGGQKFATANPSGGGLEVKFRMRADLSFQAVAGLLQNRAAREGALYEKDFPGGRRGDRDFCFASIG